MTLIAVQYQAWRDHALLCSKLGLGVIRILLRRSIALVTSESTAAVTHLLLTLPVYLLLHIPFQPEL